MRVELGDIILFNFNENHITVNTKKECMEMLGSFRENKTGKECPENYFSVYHVLLSVLHK